MFCPNCGTQNPDGQQACSKCNFQLKSAAAPKFKGTMMMNQGAMQPIPPAPKSAGPGTPPPSAALPGQGAGANMGSAGRSAFKGTVVGVAVGAQSGGGIPPTPPRVPSTPPPAPAAFGQGNPGMSGGYGGQAPTAASPYGGGITPPGGGGASVNPMGSTVADPSAYGTPPAFGGAPQQGFGGPPPAFGGQPPAFGGQPPAYGAQPGGFGGQPPAYGAQPGGFGGQPPAYGAPPQGQQPFGGPPPQGQGDPGAFGAGSGGYGAPPQAPQQGFGGGYGAPPQGQYGQPPQAGYGAPQQGFGGPPQGYDPNQNPGAMQAQPGYAPQPYGQGYGQPGAGQVGMVPAAAGAAAMAPWDGTNGPKGKVRKGTQVLLFSILSFNIYGIIWFISICNEMSAFLKRPEPSWLKIVGLSTVTCGLYGLYYFAVPFGALVAEIQQRAGVAQPQNLGWMYLIPCYNYILATDELNKAWQTPG